MALRKVTGTQIVDSSITSTNIVDGSVTGDDIVNSPAFNGTHVKVPAGTTAQRPASPIVGMVRYNTDTGLVEQYNNSGWQGIDSPPTVTGMSGIINENTNSTIIITGSNFKAGSIVYIEGAAVSGIPRALVTTYVSSTQLTAATNATAVNFGGGASYDIRVTNPSGLSALLQPAGNIDRDPLWSSPTSGSTVTLYDHQDGAQVTTYTSGATTYRVLKFTGGAGTWTSPVTGAVDILVVGGGGGGGTQVGGGGGAGGLIYRPGFQLTAGTGYNWKVGKGGNGGGYGMQTGTTYDYVMTKNQACNGESSYFGTLTALGGGAGSNHLVGAARGNNVASFNGNGQAGGSGGGGAGNSSTQNGSGGSSTQSGVGGDSSTYGFGNSGGSGMATNWAGGGGGGAGGAGSAASSANTGTGGNGGIGKQYDITGTATYYAGGGGGSWNSQTDASAVTATIAGGGGRGCANNTLVVFGTDHGEDGQPNTGGGGGGVRDLQQASGSPIRRAGHGGSGVIIIRYDISLENKTIQTLSATDPDGSTVTYTTLSSLPAGSSLIGTAIKGIANEISATTTYPITVDASSNGQSVSRSFNIVVNKANDGSSASRAAASAVDIKALTGTTISGIYWINVNGTPTEVYCDMSTDNGGWMLGMNINTHDGHIVHYVNNNFWESSTLATSFYSAAGTCVPAIRPDIDTHFKQDFKALDQGNLWANYDASKLLVVVHTNGSYLGWRSWNLNTSTVTRFSQFWQNGLAMASTTYNPANGNVYWQRKITNGQINISTGSLANGEPLVKNGVDLVANAQNGNRDLNRLTITTSANGGNTMSSGGYPVSDNAGGGLGTYYDADTQGRPECDGQIFYTATWANGRIGSDYLDNTNYSAWNGKSIGSTVDTYQWNSASGLNYDYAFYIK